jgi:hypothetical protein
MGQIRMVPHLTAPGGGFETTLTFVNTTENAHNLMLAPFDVDGNALPVVSLALEAGETSIQDPSLLFPSGAASHVTLDTEMGIEVTVGYRDAAGNNSSAHLPIATEMAFRWRIYPGELDDVLDGFAVVNLDGAAQEVFVRQLDQSGMQIQEESLFTLNPNAKGLDLFGAFQSVPGSYFEVHAQGMLAITALRFANGNPEARFFWSTAAVPLPRLETEDPDTNSQVGKVAMLRNNPTYGVSGQARIVSERTIRLEQFFYDGRGPDVRVYLGKDGDFINGPIISGSINGTVYNNATVELTLPDNVDINDYNGISIWCTVFSIDFSSGTFQ